MKAQVVSVEEVATARTCATFQALHSIWQWSFAIYKENSFLETLPKFRIVQDACCCGWPQMSISFLMVTTGKSAVSRKSGMSPNKSWTCLITWNCDHHLVGEWVLGLCPVCVFNAILLCFLDSEQKDLSKPSKTDPKWVFPFSLLHDLECDWSILCQLDLGKEFE